MSPTFINIQIDSAWQSALISPEYVVSHFFLHNSVILPGCAALVLLLRLKGDVKKNLEIFLVIELHR